MKKIQLLLTLLFIAVAANAQRHSKGVPGMEVGAGIIPDKNMGYAINAGYIRYFSDVSTLKIEALGFQYVKTFNGNNYNLQNYAGGLSYYYTPVSNRTSLFVNVGIGCYAGYENINKLKDAYATSGIVFNSKSKFVALPFVGAELEYFIFGNTALVANMKQLYSPVSDMKRWHTVIGLSIRQLLF